MTGLILPEKNQFKNQIVDSYKLIEERGRGKTAVVYKAYDESINHYVACKLIPFDTLKEGWETEIKKVARLDGVAQIVQYKKYGQTSINNKEYLYILWQFIPGTNLKEYIKDHRDSINLEFIRNVTEQILTAFHAMQVVGISHNDLHPGNILIYTDPRFISQGPNIRITDFGIGGSFNGLKPKDDYKELARICKDLLELIDPAELVDGKNKFFYDSLINDFILKKLLETDRIQGTFVRNPQELIKILNEIPDAYYRLKSEKTVKLSQPFDYLRCEQIGNSFTLLQKLYSKNFPGYEDIHQRNNTILTGPRGCGKTTIFKNLSLKIQLLAENKQGLDKNFLGIYYHCYDLYFAFPYIKSPISDDKRQAIISYFNLSIFYEILDLLDIASRKIDNGPLITKDEISRIQNGVMTYFPEYQIPPEGTQILLYFKEYVNSQKIQTRKWFNNQNRVKKPAFLPMDFISKFTKLLQKEVKLCYNKPVYFLLDDYSLPTVSKQIQETLNDFIFFPSEGSEYFFKISTESIVTFYEYTSKKKLLVQNREYVLVDIGNYFITEVVEGIDNFLSEVINNRLKNSENIDPMYYDIRTILGTPDYTSCNELARNIRNDREEGQKKKRVLYYGWPIIVHSCTGDIANILDLVKTIFSTVGPENFSKKNGVNIPIAYSENDQLMSTHIQDKAIREAGVEFLQRIGHIPEEDYGSRLKEITESFGHVANWYLMNIDSKNVKSSPPHQAYRIELQEAPQLSIELKKIYDNLIKYGIFLRDTRGKSQRGEAMDRLYLRRILIPTFKLTYSKRDPIRLDPSQFILLLSKPVEFEKMFTKKIKGRTETRAITASIDESQRSLLHE